MKTYSLLVCLILLLVLGCSSEKKDNETNNDDAEPTEEATNSDKVTESPQESELVVITGEGKGKLASYYEISYIKEFYENMMGMEYTSPPELSYPEDLSTLSYEEVRLLRNEIFARNGYLFNDGFLRGYFNRYKWYMPIFDVDSFQVVLSEKEKDLINQLLEEEEQRKQHKFIEKDGLKLYNPDLVVNTRHFKNVDQHIMDDLKANNFTITDAGRAMPFYIYDKNAYQFVPHYITTDLYLFILHKYFSKFLEKLDEEYMSKALKGLLTEARKQTAELNSDSNSSFTTTLDWLQTYLTLAAYAAGGEQASVPAQYNELAANEFKMIAQSGKPVFIENPVLSYSELKPRGHYTKSENLKKYFRGFKWISLNGADLKDETAFRGMVALAFIIKSNSSLYDDYQSYTATIEKLAGQEDNLSLKDIIEAIGDDDLSDLLSPDRIEEIRTSLNALNKERIKQVFGKDFHTPEKEAKRVFFLSSTYSLSGEIFSKLVHVQDVKSKRPFPRALDVPAAFRNKTAEKIIVDEYKDAEKWPEYTEKLAELQQQFDNFEGWNHDYGVKGVKTALSATLEEGNYPDFMKTDAYNRKELSTMLSSWTHIKHDLILYQEKPFAAEAGQGGGPEPPTHYSYVEPNIAFWNEALSLVDWLKELAKHEDSYSYQLKRIAEIGQLLRDVSKKQLAGEEITNEEFDDLHWTGGNIEHILLGLLETDHLPEREKSMALIADVYSYLGIDGLQHLNVAVGHADDIYVLVPIKGEYYIARGSTFSFYEFKDSKIYNDEEWRKKVKNSNLPNRPEWLSPIIKGYKPLEGQLEFRYVGYY